jgi:hypothetical protein
LPGNLRLTEKAPQVRGLFLLELYLDNSGKNEKGSARVSELTLLDRNALAVTARNPELRIRMRRAARLQGSERPSPKVQHPSTSHSPLFSYLTTRREH